MSSVVSVASLRSPRFVGSRFNSTAVDSDGSLVVWNSLNGGISAFPKALVESVSGLLRDGTSGRADSLSEYLVSRGFMVPAETDEYKVLQLHFGRQHYRDDRLELILLASEDCNFRCKYCYEEFPRGTMEPRVRTAVTRLLQKRVPEVRYLLVSWFGGEPLYGFEAIADIAPVAQELAVAHKVKYDGYITTNASLLTGDVAKQLLDWDIRRYQITVDGPAHLHDASRPLKDGGATYETIMRNLRAMKALTDEFFVMLRINFFKDTASELPPFVKQLAREFGSDPRFAVACHPVGKWGGPNDDELSVCGARDGQVQELSLLRNAIDSGMSTRGGIAKRASLGSNVCYAARPYNFVVGANGALMKCTVALHTDRRNIVGHIADDGSLIVDEATLGPWVEPAFQRDSTCQQCSIVPACQGISCPMVRIQRGIRPCTSTPKPALQQQLLNARYMSEHTGCSRRADTPVR